MWYGDHDSVKKVFRLKLIQWTRKMLFWQPYEIFSAGNQNFFNQSSKKIQKIIWFFQKKFFFLSFFQQKHRVELGRPRRKTFNEKLMFFCSMHELVSKIEQLSKRVFFASDWTFGHVGASFGRSNEFFFGRGPKIVYSISENVEEAYKFFQKKMFLFSKRCDGNIECSFENALKNIWQKVEKSSSKSEYDKKTKILP